MYILKSDLGLKRRPSCLLSSVVVSGKIYSAALFTFLDIIEDDLITHLKMLVPILTDIDIRITTQCVQCYGHCGEKQRGLTRYKH